MPYRVRNFVFEFNKFERSRCNRSRPASRVQKPYASNRGFRVGIESRSCSPTPPVSAVIRRWSIYFNYMNRTMRWEGARSDVPYRLRWGVFCFFYIPMSPATFVLAYGYRCCCTSGCCWQQKHAVHATRIQHRLLARFARLWAKIKTRYRHRRHVAVRPPYRDTFLWG